MMSSSLLFPQNKTSQKDNIDKNISDVRNVRIIAFLKNKSRIKKAR